MRRLAIEPLEDRRLLSRVIGVDPTANSHAAPGDADVSAVYDQAIDPQTVSSLTFVAQGMQSGRFDGVLSVDGATVLLDPQSYFAPGELVQITATAGIRDGVSGGSAEPWVWQFRAEALAGSGSFGPSEQQFGTPKFDSLAVALDDLDGDGDLDAFVGNYGPDGSSAAVGAPNQVWLNDGQGYFTESGQRLGDSATRAVALGDLDGDGDIDALAANYAQPDTVWLNDGQGRFSRSGQELGGLWSTAVVLGDLDGDGDLDALVANNDNLSPASKVWLNDGHGSFTDGGSAPGYTSSRCSSIALGDLDGDGDLDAFLGGKEIGRLWPPDETLRDNGVWLNDGQGNFTGIEQDWGETTANVVTLGDLDGDGDLDAFLGSTETDRSGPFGGGTPWGHNSVWLNDGQGNFIESWQFLDDPDGIANAISLADLDGDGDLDAFITNRPPYPNLPVEAVGNTVWINDGWGYFYSDWQRLGMGDSADVALGDLDGDGNVDAFVANHWPRTNKVWLGDGTGWFVDGGRIQDGSEAAAVAVGDLNGDGQLDVFVGNDGPNQVWLSDGQGRFERTAQALGDSLTAGVALGDLDGDGDLDAFVTNEHGVFMRFDKVWLNDGQGQFSDSGQALGDGAGGDVALGDLDGDGDLDAFVANLYGPNTVWLNDGQGWFSDSFQRLGDASRWSTSVALGDLDGDGDLDAFVGNVNDTPKPDEIWFNDGSGFFSDSGQRIDTLFTRSVALGDLDGDGDLDAFLANDGRGGQYKINKVWLNDGQGEFSDSGQRIGNWQSRAAALGDFDADGDLDAYVANLGQHDRMWLNDGLGQFTDSGQILGDASSQAVAIGDLDGDGDLDAFVGNNDGQPNAIWLNLEGDVDLSVTTDDQENTAVAGAALSYTVTVANHGPVDVAGATVIDAFPPQLRQVAWTAVATGGASCVTAGVGDIYELVDLPVGSTITYTATGNLDPTAAGTITNTASVTAPDGLLDWPQQNNTRFDTDVVVLPASGGSGQFGDTGQQLGDLQIGGRYLLLGDLDGDGDLDTFVVNVGGPNSVWFNDGEGRFVDSGQNVGDWRSKDAVLGDFDRDGDLDVFVTNSPPDYGAPDSDKLWLNDGHGNFTDSGQDLDFIGGRRLAVGDLDGDGDLDVFLGDSVHQVWLNDGQEGFSDTGKDWTRPTTPPWTLPWGTSTATATWMRCWRIPRTTQSGSIMGRESLPRAANVSTTRAGPAPSNWGTSTGTAIWTP